MRHASYTGVEVFMMAKVLYLICFEICTPEGGGEKMRECKFENKAHRTFDIINALTSNPLLKTTENTVDD